MTLLRDIQRPPGINACDKQHELIWFDGFDCPVCDLKERFDELEEEMPWR